ncbi:MAG: DUF2332 domain-containing protein [Ilumatobacteraceae bacterium]
MTDLDEIAQRFRATAADSKSRAPLYAKLAGRIADDPATSRLLFHAPAEQRLPVLLFACVHWLLLHDPDDALAAHYPNLTPDADPDPDLDGAYPAFRAFCERHEPRLAGLLATRSTQTNEVGRCATLLPVLGRVSEEVGPLALVDVGASGGLNLLFDRYEYHYEPGGRVGGPSPVVLPCGTRGDVPVPRAFPAVGARIGLDRSPIDLTDPDAARWLEACVWPDQADRFHRLHAAIGLAQLDPPRVRAGDAVGDLGATIALVDGGGHPVVVNSWVLNYLSEGQRRAYVAELERIGAGRDLSWVYAEMPALVSGVPVPDDPERVHRTVVTLVRWRGGTRTVEHLAETHPHGFWIHWR